MTCQVLFLCTGNSCRSHLAEAIVNARLSDDWAAVSAGAQPAGYVHPMVIRTLAEIGIDMLVKIPDLLRRYAAL